MKTDTKSRKVPNYIKYQVRSLGIDSNLHSRLKNAATTNGLGMTELANKMLTYYLPAWERRGKKRLDAMIKSVKHSSSTILP